MTRFRGPWKLALLWTLSLVFVAIVASTMAAAQWPFSEGETGIVSGGDIGFRVESTKGETPYGTLMVRINGKWVEAALAPKLRPAR